MRSRLTGLAALSIGLSTIPLGSVSAQEPPPVSILPVDRAEFMPGALFDLRVEVHADALPDDFTVTVNGEDAATFFGAEPIPETWTFEGFTSSYGTATEPAAIPARSVIWRDLSIDEPGDYEVSVTADGATKSARWTVREPAGSAGARNVILFVADGMSVPLITAARLVSRGNVEGKYLDTFAMDRLEEIGLVHTSGLDSIITDSANSASAYNTGHKSAVNALGVYPDTSPDSLDDPKVETFAELVKRARGMSVGIVTTSDWTDATPAAVFAHTRRRGDRAVIAADALDRGLLPEVILGGGERYMLPSGVEGTVREDDRDLMAEYEQAGYTVVRDATSLAAAVGEDLPERLLGLFKLGDMNVWLDRNVYTDNLGSSTDQPGLPAMTTAALDVLAQDPDGFYLMVEGASVDKQIHPLDQERALADLIEFDEAVATAVDWVAANAPDTLIVVTADHGHGYDVYGTVDVPSFRAATDDLGRRAAIRTYDSAGFPTYVDADGDGYPDTWDVDVTLAGTVNNSPPYTEDYQVSTVPRVPAIEDASGAYVDNPDDDPAGITVNGNLPPSEGAGVHTLQDVPIFASGPGADAFGHVIDNTEVFFGMADAIGLDPRETGD